MATSWHKNALIGLYLAVQLTLPLGGLMREPFESRGNFSWNMYSQHYRCEIDYATIDSEGGKRPIKYRRGFNRPGIATRVHNREMLPKLHAWLCDDAARVCGFATVIASGACRWNGGPWVQLIEPHVDICSDPNYAVRPSG